MKKQITRIDSRQQVILAMAIIFILLLSSTAGCSQATFIKKIAIGDSIFTIEVIKVVNKPTTAKVCVGEVTKGRCQQFDFYTESYSVFQKSLYNSVKNLLPASAVNKPHDDSLRNVINFISDDIYRDLLAFQISDNEEVPVAGFLKFYRNVVVEPNIVSGVPCMKSRRVDTLRVITDTNKRLLDTLQFRLDRMNKKRSGNVPGKFAVSADQKKIADLQAKLVDYKLTENKIRRKFSWIIGEIRQDYSTMPLIVALDSVRAQERRRAVTSMIITYANDAKICVTELKLPYPDSSLIKFYIDKMVLLYYGKCTPQKIKRKTLKKEIYAGKATTQRLDSLILLGDRLISLSDTIDSLGMRKSKIQTLISKRLLYNLKQIFQSSDSLKKQLAKCTDDYTKLNSSFPQSFKTLTDINKPISGWAKSNALQDESFDRSIRVVDSLNTNTNEIRQMLEVMGKNLEQRINENQRSKIQKDALAKQAQEDLEKTQRMLMEIVEVDTDQAQKSLIHKKDSLQPRVNELTNLVKEAKEEIQRIEKISDDLQKLNNKVLFSQLLVDDLMYSIESFNSGSISYQLEKRELDKIGEKKDKLEKNLANLLLTPMIKVDSVHIEFNDGVLKNIVVEGKYGETELIFTNSSPVQFTGITHLEKLTKIELVDMYTRSYKIRLTDVMKYVPVLHVDAEDYSPSDSVYNCKIGTMSSVVQPAYKERQNQILEARAFTDLVGLNAQQPNGLLQFEVCKKIPLFTHRIKYCKQYRSFISFGSYYYPQFTLSKLEQNNKYYYVEDLDVNSGKATISTLDIYKFSSIKMKLLYLNLFNWEIAEVKSAMEINGGFTLLYTPLKDSISTPNTTSQWGTVSGMPFTELKFLIKPDVRYGFSISGGVGWIFNWDNKLLQINNPVDPGSGQSYSRLLFTFQFDAFYKPFRRSDNAAFFRVANMHTWPFNATYLQVQVGYSFNIFKNSASKTK